MADGLSHGEIPEAEIWSRKTMQKMWAHYTLLFSKCTGLAEGKQFMKICISYTVYGK